jgi:hypothetical protein
MVDSGEITSLAAGWMSPTDLGCAKTPKGCQLRGIAFFRRLHPGHHANASLQHSRPSEKIVLRFLDAVEFSRGQDPEQTKA